MHLSYIVYCCICGSIVFFFAEGVNITLEPSNPTEVLINSDVELNWNFSVGSAFFREVNFARISPGVDERIGLIIRGISRPGKIVILDDWAAATGRFEIRAPATLIIRNVTADDATFYKVEAQSIDGFQLRKDKTVIYLDVLGKLNIFFYLFLVFCFLQRNVRCGT